MNNKQIIKCGLKCESTLDFKMPDFVPNRKNNKLFFHQKKRAVTPSSTSKMLYNRRKHNYNGLYSLLKESLVSPVLKNQDREVSHAAHWKRPRELDQLKHNQDYLEKGRNEKLYSEKVNIERKAKDKNVEKFWRTKLRKFTKRKAKIDNIIKKNEQKYKYRNYIKLAKGIDLHDEDDDEEYKNNNNRIY